MYGTSDKRRFWAVAAVVFATVLLAPSRVSAALKTADDAEAVVRGWLWEDDTPLDADVGWSINRVDTYVDGNDDPVFYVVDLAPTGFVIVPADDQITPIIAFSESDEFDVSLENPLGALVSADLLGRVYAARDQLVEYGVGGTPPDPTDAAAAQDKWDELQELADNPVEFGLGTISDVRVAPLLESEWGQSVAWYSGPNCYNYYTPSNYVCGCVATAMAQLMRFHEHPTTGVGTTSFSVAVDGVSTTRPLRGGDNAGGPYNWSDMILVPHVQGVTTAQCQAIGALCNDAAVSVNMSFTASGSGTDTLAAANAFVSVFDYSNAVPGRKSDWTNIGAPLTAMVNPNLDAGLPVLLGITGSGGGHAIVCDGYGYSGATLYHHLNMGWYGTDNAWYVLPNINSSTAFTSVYKCVYNVFPTGTGEIISGRVLDASGDPVAGAVVSATRSGGGSYSDTTDANGVYALAKIPAASSYTVSVTADGMQFTSQNISTGASTANTTTSGNVWGVDFTATDVSEPAELTSHVDGDTLSGSSVTFTWSAGVDVTEYRLSVGSTSGGGQYFNASCGTSLSQAVSGLPVSGADVYVRLSSLIDGAWQSRNYTLSAATSSAAALTSHSDGDTLAGGAVTFTWSAAAGATQYWLRVGSVQGYGDYFGGSCGTNTSQAVSGLPLDGGDVYVDLFTYFGQTYLVESYTLTAASASAAALTSHNDGDTLAGSSATFAWNDVGADEYRLRVGSVAGYANYFGGSCGTNTSQAVANLRSDGGDVYVELLTYFDGVALSNSYVFTAFDAESQKAALTSHTDGDTLAGGAVTFTWNAVGGATEYFLKVGSVAGYSNYFGGSCGTNTSQLVSKLPVDGSAVYVRLYTCVGGAWVYNDYTFTAFDGAASAAALTSHSGGDTLASGSETFTWNAVGGATEYFLKVGSVAGYSNYFGGSCGTNTSQVVSKLPVDGSTVYFRLYTYVGGAWIYNDYSFTAVDAQSSPPAITSHADDDVLAGASDTFTWDAAPGATLYYIRVGSVLGYGNYYAGGTGTTPNVAVSKLPTNGSTVYIRLYTFFGGTYVYTDRRVTASN